MSKTGSPTHTATWPNDSFAFSPGLAAKVGQNEALVLSTVHAQLQNSKNLRDGHHWVFHPSLLGKRAFSRGGVCRQLSELSRV